MTSRMPRLAGKHCYAHTLARHLRVDKPCISLRDRMDNDKAVAHTYAPFAHTPMEVASR